MQFILCYVPLFLVTFILDKAVPISWPHKGDIVFENVSLRYENQEENIISNLNLRIEAGQRVSNVGERDFYLG